MIARQEDFVGPVTVSEARRILGPAAADMTDEQIQEEIKAMELLAQGLCSEVSTRLAAPCRKAS